MKSVGTPVSRPGASKPRFFTSSSPGVPIGWTVSVSPSATTSALLVAEPRRHQARDQEQDQPEVRDAASRAWSSDSGRRTGSGCRPVPSPARTRKRWRRSAAATAAAVSPGPARSRRGPAAAGRSTASGWTTRIVADCCHSRGVRSRVQMHDRDREDQQRDRERRRGEDVEQLEPLHEVDDRPRRGPARRSSGAGPSRWRSRRRSGRRSPGAAGSSCRRPRGPPPQRSGRPRS